MQCWSEAKDVAGGGREDWERPGGGLVWRGEGLGEAHITQSRSDRTRFSWPCFDEAGALQALLRHLRVGAIALAL